MDFLTTLHKVDIILRDQLGDYFSSYGEVTDCKIICNPDTQVSRGFGFVVFANKETVDSVLKHKNEHFINGKWIDCKSAMLRQEINLEVDLLYEKKVTTHKKKDTVANQQPTRHQNISGAETTSKSYHHSGSGGSENQHKGYHHPHGKTYGDPAPRYGQSYRYGPASKHYDYSGNGYYEGYGFYRYHEDEGYYEDSGYQYDPYYPPANRNHRYEAKKASYHSHHPSHGLEAKSGIRHQQKKEISGSNAPGLHQTNNFVLEQAARQNLHVSATPEEGTKYHPIAGTSYQHQKMLPLVQNETPESYGKDFNLEKKTANNNVQSLPNFKSPLGDSSINYYSFETNFGPKVLDRYGSNAEYFTPQAKLGMNIYHGQLPGDQTTQHNRFRRPGAHDSKTMPTLTGFPSPADNIDADQCEQEDRTSNRM